MVKPLIFGYASSSNSPEPSSLSVPVETSSVSVPPLLPPTPSETAAAAVANESKAGGELKTTTTTTTTLSVAGAAGMKIRNASISQPLSPSKLPVLREANPVTGPFNIKGEGSKKALESPSTQDKNPFESKIFNPLPPIHSASPIASTSTLSLVPPISSTFTNLNSNLNLKSSTFSSDQSNEGGSIKTLQDSLAMGDRDSIQPVVLASSDTVEPNSSNSASILPSPPIPPTPILPTATTTTTTTAAESPFKSTDNVTIPTRISPTVIPTTSLLPPLPISPPTPLPLSPIASAPSVIPTDLKDSPKKLTPAIASTSGLTSTPSPRGRLKISMNKKAVDVKKKAEEDKKAEDARKAKGTVKKDQNKFLEPEKGKEVGQGKMIEMEEGKNDSIIDEKEKDTSTASLPIQVLPTQPLSLELPSIVTETKQVAEVTLPASLSSVSHSLSRSVSEEGEIRSPGSTPSFSNSIQEVLPTPTDQEKTKSLHSSLPPRPPMTSLPLPPPAATSALPPKVLPRLHVPRSATPTPPRPSTTDYSSPTSDYIYGLPKSDTAMISASQREGPNPSLLQRITRDEIEDVVMNEPESNYARAHSREPDVYSRKKDDRDRKRRSRSYERSSSRSRSRERGREGRDNGNYNDRRRDEHRGDTREGRNDGKKQSREERDRDRQREDEEDDRTTKETRSKRRAEEGEERLSKKNRRTSPDSPSSSKKDRSHSSSQKQSRSTRSPHRDSSKSNYHSTSTSHSSRYPDSSHHRRSSRDISRSPTRDRETDDKRSSGIGGSGKEWGRNSAIRNQHDSDRYVPTSIEGGGRGGGYDRGYANSQGQFNRRTSSQDDNRSNRNAYPHPGNPDLNFNRGALHFTARADEEVVLPYENSPVLPLKLLSTPTGPRSQIPQRQVQTEPPAKLLQKPKGQIEMNVVRPTSNTINPPDPNRFNSAPSYSNSQQTSHPPPQISHLLPPKPSPDPEPPSESGPPLLPPLLPPPPPPSGNQAPDHPPLPASFPIPKDPSHPAITRLASPDSGPNTTGRNTPNDITTKKDQDEKTAYRIRSDLQVESWIKAPSPSLMISGPPINDVSGRSDRVIIGASKITEYVLQEKLGEGTFGVVWKGLRGKADSKGKILKMNAKEQAHENKLIKAGSLVKNGDVVALKEIIMHNEGDGMPITSLREIRILKHLDHPNVVPVVDMAYSDGDESNFTLGKTYMVFPYMEHDLTGLLENNNVKLTDPVIKQYAKQLLLGTAYLHRNNIIHRDIKAANLLINNEGVLMIADFGLARTMCKSEPGRNYTNMVVTRWYRPPELLLGESCYDTAVDMWGVGCVIAEMYKKSPIFPGESDLDQAQRIFNLCGDPTQMLNNKAYTGCEGTTFFKKEPRQVFAKFQEYGDNFADLMDKILVLDPKKRFTARQALDHDWFWNHPLPSKPEAIPRWPSSHEFDKRLREEGMNPSYQPQSISRPLIVKRPQVLPYQSHPQVHGGGGGGAHPNPQYQQQQQQYPPHQNQLRPQEFNHHNNNNNYNNHNNNRNFGDNNYNQYNNNSQGSNGGGGGGGGKVNLGMMLGGSNPPRSTTYGKPVARPSASARIQPPQVQDSRASKPPQNYET